ncbi:hypothetical protein C1H46_007224 [Malus baccata]|uniref:RRM domain-containing protein n=1 Tax=Malus baccata TaxID=106549 RepID=A0A540N7Y8_MALBA|nr:hypothetical protein C1H46_007224 [Malus baccata]
MKLRAQKTVHRNPAQRPTKSTSSDGVSEPKTRGLIKIRVSKVFPFRKFRSKEVRLLRTSLVVRTIHCVQKLTELDMRRYSPQYYSPPRRSYGGGGGGGGRGRSPPRRRKEQNTGSLLVRNIPLDCREPRGFAFIQFVDSYEAAEAQYHMNGKIFAGREISVVVAAETRKRPEEMRQRTRRAIRPWGKTIILLWSYSPAPRRRGDSISPSRRRRDNPRSPRDLPPLRDGDHDRRPYSPGYDNGAGPIENADGYDKKPMREDKDGRDHWRSPDRASRSPSGSRSRSAELSPPRSR